MKPFSSEQTEKLEHYVTLLKKWQKSINLVSNNTIEDAWQRHIIDSAQLADYLPQDVRVLDIGSGAGFPGLVLAILRPDLNITLVESDTRKCVFMQNVSRETSANIKILNQRIENVSRETSLDFITARALASVKILLGYAENFLSHNPNLSLLLLKGEKAEDEIVEAKNFYSFEVQSFQSLTNSAARILKITNVSRETSACS